MGRGKKVWCFVLSILLTNISLHVYYSELWRRDSQFESLLLFNKDRLFEAMLLETLWGEVRAMDLQEDVITTVCVCVCVCVSTYMYEGTE